MIKSSLYTIFSIIFISASVLIVFWIIQQESRRDETKQESHIILNEANDDEKNISNQTDITDYAKKDISSALLEIDNLVNAVDKTEVPE